MTYYSKMTDAEINEAIFKAKGWREIYSVFEKSVWRKDEGNENLWSTSLADLPDYTHSWELCGELLEEMKSADVDLMYFKTLNKWGVDWLDNDEVEYERDADTPQRAICEAWLAWREQ